MIKRSVAILGYGQEGKAAHEYFAAMGYKVAVFDTNADKQSEVGPETDFFVYTDNLKALEEFDLVCRSPGIRPDAIPQGVTVTSVTKEFFKECQSRIIGVTGTKGKGTTATLIARILDLSGERVHLLGNIGKPAVAALDDIDEDDIVVYELSSFQLWDMDQSPSIAVVLMISEDHMDVHHSMDEYVNAKSQITKHQASGDVVIHHPTNQYTLKAVSESDSKHLKYLSDEGANIEDGTITIDGRQICRVDEVGLLGPHNLENICAAITAAWQVTKDTEAVGRAVREFRGLEHRLQQVGSVSGVKYIDDSFSTNDESAIAAIRSFDEPKLLILGGSEKGQSYERLTREIAASNMRKVFLIGETARSIAKNLDSAGYRDYQVLETGEMSEIVAQAAKSAQPGDVVLLSPACASFGLFENYKQRGELFTKAVRQL